MPQPSVDDYSSFGEALRHFRRAAGLQQEELAERAGVSVYTISNLERGVVHTPHKDTVQLLAQALSLSPEDMAAFIAAAPTRMKRSEAKPTRDVRVASSPTDLPRPITPLIGREHEVAEIGALMKKPDVRLVTLTGAGGVGKTRLALACAHAVAQSFADGANFISLAAETEIQGAATTITHALGVKERGKRTPTDRLVDWLHGQQLLLVLDNLEQIPGIPLFLTQLLERCLGLTVLGTSRTPLNIAGEHRFEVLPLTLPADADRLPLEQLATIPAVALFLERAQAARLGFILTADNAAAITAICRGLDGLPLALELAAPQLALLSPGELLARLGHRLSALSAGGPDRPARQQTLRATLDWSYDLLDPVAQAGLRWLSVCAGGSTLEAAETLCAQARSGSPDRYMNRSATTSLEVIVRLARHHLLQRQPGESSEADRRLTMLATIAEYASDRLHENAAETLLAARAHAQVYLDVAETAAAGLQGAEQKRWLQRLSEEQGNMRAALRWSHQQRDGPIALRLVAALWMYWNTVGMLSEGRDWLEQALTLAPPAETLDAAGQRPLAEAYNGAGVLATRQGDFAAAERYLAQALPLRRALGDPLALASSLNSLGGFLMQQGRLGEAQEVWEESLVYRRASGDKRAIALGLMNLGVLALNRGKIRTAVFYSEESALLFRATGDESMLATALINLAMASCLTGELAMAQASVETGLQIARQQEQRRQIGHGLIVQSELAHARGKLDQAEALALEGLALWREIGAQTNVALMLALLGTLQCERGDLDAAEILFRESLTLSEQLADQMGLADVWTRLGHLARLHGAWEQAATAYQRSLRVSVEIESLAGVPDALEGLAVALHGCRETEQTERAIHLCALAQALRARTGAVRAPYNDRSVAPILGALQAEAGKLRWEASNAAVAALTIAQLQAKMAEHG